MTPVFAFSSSGRRCSPSASVQSALASGCCPGAQGGRKPPFRGAHNSSHRSLPSAREAGFGSQLSVRRHQLRTHGFAARRPIWCKRATALFLCSPPQRRWSSTGYGASRKGAAATMTLLAWNCRGSGGSLSSSTMVHLACLLSSTKSQVCFISETRNASISRTSLINRFSVVDAFVVPAQGQSGGLWLIWKQDIIITVVDHSPNYIFGLCDNTVDHKQFGLVCLYG